MRKSVFAMTVATGLLATPVYAQLGGVTGGAGAGGAVGGAVGGVGAPSGPAGVDTDIGGKAGAGVGVGADVDTGAGAKAGVGTGTNAGVGVNAPTGAVNPRMGTASGITVGVEPRTGFVGRTVVDANGKTIGTVKGLGTSADLSSVNQVFVKTGSGAKMVALTPTQLAGNASGQLVAQGVTAADAGALPAVSGHEQMSLVGRTVLSADGKTLGTVDNLVIDEKTGALGSLLIDTGKSGNAKIVAMERSHIASDAKGNLTAPKLSAAEFKAITTAQAAGKAGGSVQ